MLLVGTDGDFWGSRVQGVHQAPAAVQGLLRRPGGSAVRERAGSRRRAPLLEWRRSCKKVAFWLTSVYFLSALSQVLLKQLLFQSGMVFPSVCVKMSLKIRQAWDPFSQASPVHSK